MTISIVSAGNIYILGLATLEKGKSRYYNIKKQILQYKKLIIIQFNT